MNKRQLLLSVGATLISPMIFASNSPISDLIGSRGAFAAGQPAMPAPPKSPKDSLKGKRLCIASPVTIDQLTLFYADMQKAAKQSENGLEITVADAKGDFEKQLAQVEEYVASGNCSASTTWLKFKRSFTLPAPRTPMTRIAGMIAKHRVTIRRTHGVSRQCMNPSITTCPARVPVIVLL